MKKLILKYRSILLYLIFGVLTTLINMAAYYLLDRAGLSTAVANGIAWVLAVTTAYLTNRVWVFESKATGKAIISECLRFFGCRVGTGLLDEGIMVLCVDILGLPGNLVKLFANVLVIMLNYVFSRLLIFKKGSDNE